MNYNLKEKDYIVGASISLYKINKIMKYSIIIHSLIIILKVLYGNILISSKEVGLRYESMFFDNTLQRINDIYIWLLCMVSILNIFFCRYCYLEGVDQFRRKKIIIMTACFWVFTYINLMI